MHYFVHFSLEANFKKNFSPMELKLVYNVKYTGNNSGVCIKMFPLYVWKALDARQNCPISDESLC